MTLAVRPGVSGGLYLEDHVVGQVVTSDPITFSRERVARYADAVGDSSSLHDPNIPGSTVHGPLIQAMLISWMVDTGVAARVLAELDHTWHYTKPVHIGESVTFRITFTRIQRSRSRTKGVVHRTIEVLGADGDVLQHATSRILVEARMAVDDTQERVRTAIGTAEWARLLADALEKDGQFTRLTSTWDGTIGFGIGGETMLLRVYKGRILDVGRRMPHGPTFTVHASEKTWVELVTGPENDFTRRAMCDQFRTTGDAYEYLRLNRTLVAVIDVMRALAREEK
ncbi:hypothetical protein [Streptomyces sp. NPDC004629]|uniref:hypothetical protein n=1 Tax=Streptomyces sp. NPDC004629 TaxID=3364705 RepID=UPI0036B38556